MENGIYKINAIRYSPSAQSQFFNFVGRIIITDGELRHLEDRFGMLDRLMPEGPLKTQEATLRRLERSPYWRVEKEVPAPQDDQGIVGVPNG